LTLGIEFHAKALPLPKSIVLVHGGVAVVGFVLLMMAVFGGAVKPG